MENAYTSLSLAIQALKAEGYTEDFNLSGGGLENKRKKVVNPMEELHVVKYYRFEGNSNPADNAVLFVIETSGGDKGLLVDAYGMYSGEVDREFLRRLIMDGTP